MTIPFSYLITLEPLGLLYASSGRFLSAENLVGKAGEHFPPDSPAMSGLIASKLHRSELLNLFTAGPFWRNSKDLYLPAPLTLLQNKADENCLNRTICERLAWHAPGVNSDLGGWMPTSGREIPAKPIRGGWIALSQWMNQTTANAMVHVNPWKAVPHLHPRLCDNERVSAQENALFMELAVALEPGVSLAYISSHNIPEGRYRFGGEGHLVELRCEQIPEALLDLLKQPIKASFALITPGVWGGSRLSQREPFLPTVLALGAIDLELVLMVNHDYLVAVGQCQLAVAIKFQQHCRCRHGQTGLKVGSQEKGSALNNLVQA
uniref:CRISPR-associated protein Cmr3 n=1 Tax=Synechococcus lacustris str. Tous TaxID=1910958 RepID=A0A2P7ECW2_9SYNE